MGHRNNSKKFSSLHVVSHILFLYPTWVNNPHRTQLVDLPFLQHTRSLMAEQTYTETIDEFTDSHHFTEKGNITYWQLLHIFQWRQFRPVFPFSYMNSTLQNKPTRAGSKISSLQEVPGLNRITAAASPDTSFFLWRTLVKKVSSSSPLSSSSELI